MAPLASLRDEELFRTARLAEYGAMAASALHELRQPLLAIKALAQLLCEHEDKKVSSRAQIISQQSQRIESILEQHRSFLVRDESAKRSVNIAEVLTEAVELTSPHVKRCRGELEIKKSGEVPEVLAGRAQLVHAVVNLIVNAADAVEAVGGGRIAISTQVDDGRLAITVSDAGVGVPSHAESKLFKTLFTTKAADKGSGFGLFICQRVAENHGGRAEYLRLDPSRENGYKTAFRLSFPLREQRPTRVPLPSISATPNREPVREPVREPPRERATPVNRPSILIVDDEPVVRLVLSELLQPDGYELEEAASAEEALKLLQRRSYGLLITDKNLAHMDGLGLIESARRLHPRLLAILMTGYPSLVSARKALELGIVAYLTKPFDDTKAVRARIRSVFAQPEAAKPGAPSAPGSKVVVFEPREQHVHNLTRALRGLGFEPIVAGDIASAKRLMENGYTGAVISWEAAEGTGELNSLAASRRVVLMTDEISFDKMVAAISVGAKACLPRQSANVELLSKELGRAFTIPE